MRSLLLQLVSDTQLYLRDPLLPKGSMLAAKEDCIQVVEAPVLQPETPLFTPAPPPPAKSVPPPPDTSLEMKQTLTKMIPGMRLVDQVPDDKSGTQRGNAWQAKIADAEVIVLACKQDTETVEFLKTLAKAIDTRLAKAKILSADKLEAEGMWPLFLEKNTFRLIVASEGLEQLKGLMRFYRGSPAQGAHFLDQIPLLPLLSAPLYKQLDKKANVWKTLCQILKP